MGVDLCGHCEQARNGQKTRFVFGGKTDVPGSKGDHADVRRNFNRGMGAQTMSKERDYLCLFRSKFEVMMKLSDAGLREIVGAMYAFLDGKKIVFTDAQAQALWWTWELEFEAANKKYAEIVERRKEAGRLGGFKKQENLANLANASKCQQMLAKPSKSSYTDTDTDTDNKEEIYKEEKETATAKPTRTRFRAPTLEEVSAYIAEKGLKAVEAIDFYEYYESKGWKVGNAPMKSWQMALNRWNRENLRRGSGQQTGLRQPRADANRLKKLKLAWKHMVNYDYDMHDATELDCKILGADSVESLKRYAGGEFETLEELVSNPPYILAQKFKNIA